jgi:hypothetical protein
LNGSVGGISISGALSFICFLPTLPDSLPPRDSVASDTSLVPQKSSA